MDITDLSADDDAVSPVIGVILMVAVTVILAAVIGAFVLGIGSQVTDTAPSVKVNFEYENSTTPSTVINITHDGGDPVEENTLSVNVGGDEVDSGCIKGTGSDFTAGDSIEVDESLCGSSFGSGDEVLLIYEQQGQDGATAILGEGEIE